MKSRSLPSILTPVTIFFLKFVATVFFYFSSTVISFADIHTWVAATGGAWTTTTNWLPAGLPVAGDDIVINTDQSGSITNVPTLGINSLSVSGTCALVGTGGGTTLTVGGVTGTDFTVSIGKTLTIGANLNISLAGNATSSIDGTLIVSPGRTFNTNGTGVTTTVNGTLVSFGTITCSTAAKLLFQSGSTYNHALNGGTIPTATWADGSTCNVTGVVANQPDAVSLGQNFYNLIWNNPGQTWNPTTGSMVAGADYKIRGTFTFISSGTGSNIWPSLNCTVANYVHTGGIDRLSYSNPRTHTIGNFTVSGGTVDFTQSTGTPIINISGNVSVTGGDVTVSGTGNVTINFVGTTIQTFTSGGTFSGTQSWNILSGSTVDFGTSLLTGVATSNFTLNDGGSIITANQDGLNTSGATGSIQVGGTRTYGIGANYIYNGVDPQVTGNGLTGAANLTINNPSGLTLSSNLAVSGMLIFMNGLIITGTNTLSMGLAASVSGADMGTYVFGNLLWNIPTGAQNKTFDIGDETRYTPVTVVFNNITTAGTLTGSSRGITHPNLGTSPISSSKYIKRVFSFTAAGMVFGTANVTLNWGLSDIQGFANYTRFMVGLYNSGWTTPTFTGRTSNSIQATNLTFFGDLQVGESACTAPAISGVPVSQSVTYGEDAIFSVSATGTGLSYKWQEDSGTGFINITDGGIYSNSATATLNLTKPAVSANGNKYRCVITGTCGAVTSNGNATLFVSKKALLITAGFKSKEYDGAIFPISSYTVTYSGFLTGEGETDLGGTLSFTGTAITAINAGTYVITPGNLTSVNYNISFVDGTLIITKKALTVTAVNKIKEYDGAVFPVSNYTVSFSGFISGEDGTALGGTLGFTGTAIEAVSSGTFVITPANLISANYYITFISGSLDITKKTLTITADNKSKTYGETNPSLTISYSGFVTGDNPSVITVPSVSTSVVEGSSAGTYAITLSGGAAVNYSLSLVNGLFTVAKAALRAAADNKVKIYGTENPVLTISYSGFVNGDNSASITGPAISTICVTGSSVGTYPITLSGGTTANYTITLVNGIITVNKAIATVTLGNLSTVYDGTGKVATATTSPYGLTVNFTYNGSLTVPVNAGTYVVDCTVSSINYLGSASGNLVIGKAPQIITFNNIPSGLRMTEEHQLEASASSGLPVSIVSSNSNIVSISGSIITVKGDGTITLTASQSGNNNWLSADDVVQTVVTLPTFDNVSFLFTPNNDGMNDYWYIPGLEDYGTLQVTVYNRFGQAVYKSDDYKNDWDGTWNGNPLPSASYYYIMKSGKKGLSKGIVNIIR